MASILFSILIQAAFAKKEITFEWLSDLNFGTLVQGDLGKTVSPSDTAGRATLKIKGEPNHSFTVHIPNNAIRISNESERCNDKLTLSQFRTQLPSNSQSVFDAQGVQMVYIGATLQAIPNSISRGKYSGHYSVTAIY
jgi:hypothetical protein